MVAKKSSTTIFVPWMWRKQVPLRGVMAQKANQNSLKFALDDKVSGQFQPATALSTMPIYRRLVGSQSQSGRRDDEYAV